MTWAGIKTSVATNWAGFKTGTDGVKIHDIFASFLESMCSVGIPA